MDLKMIKAKPLNRKSRMRVGRGRGTGKGKTCGRGHKGQKARSGYKWHAYFEGGQMPLYRRLPKKGFTNARFKSTFYILNIRDLKDYEAGDTVDLESAKSRNLVKKKASNLKILGVGELEVKLTVKANRFSETARRKIEAAGGVVEEI